MSQKIFCKEFHAIGAISPVVGFDLALTAAELEERAQKRFADQQQSGFLNHSYGEIIELEVSDEFYEAVRDKNKAALPSVEVLKKLIDDRHSKPHL